MKKNPLTSVVLIFLILTMGLLLSSCSESTEPKKEVSTPVFSPDGGVYPEPQEVTISCETEGATIRFTLDGSNPTELSIEYTSAIMVDSTTTIKAQGFKEGWESSDVATAEYIITDMPIVSNPVISPPGGNYTEPQTITITCDTPDAEIRYTLDSSEPTEESDLYTDPFNLSANTTVKARAFKEEYVPSEIVSETYSFIEPSNIAIVVLDLDDPTTSETSTYTLFESIVGEPNFIGSPSATYENLEEYDLIVGVEEDCLSAEVINQLISDGKNVLLLFSSGSVLGGNWSSTTLSGARNLIIESDEVFFDGYTSNLSMTLQDTGTAFTVTEGYPAGWNIIGRNTRYSHHKTVLYREHAGGGKGLIYTYNPASYTGIGYNLFDMIYEWFTDIAVEPGVIIPPGHVAFVISGYDDSGTPDLTDIENAHYSNLLNYGYDVTFIRFSRLKNSDLSGATMITAAEYPSIDSYSPGEQIAAGKNVFLAYSSAASISGNWSSTTLSGARNLIVESDEVFLDGYTSNLSMTVQETGTAFTVTEGYPAGWNIIGRNTRYSHHKTVLYREHAGGGKGLIYTYNPTSLTGTGKNVSDMIYEWFEDTPFLSGVIVPSGNVAFVISGYDDSGTPELTDIENAHYSSLLNYGYDVTFIRFSRLKNSDLSGATMITAAEYPSIDSYTPGEQITAGKNVYLAFNSAASISGNWSSTTLSGARELIIESDEVFFDGYTSNLSMTVQDTDTAFTVTEGYPAGWNIIGRNSRYSHHKTVLYREHAGGGKGLIYTYNPTSFSGTGKNVSDMIYEWFEDTPFLPGVNVPSGHVAFILSGYDDSGTAELTDIENAHYSNLLGHGYDVTFIRFSRLKNSDLSGAALVTAARYPSIDSHSVEDQLALGNNVLLVYDSASSINGSWNSSSLSGDRNLVVENNSDYLASYSIDETIIIQNAGTAFRITSDYPSGWTILGRNSRYTEHKTAFSRTVAGAKGVIYTYNPTDFSGEGEVVFDAIIDWLD